MGFCPREKCEHFNKVTKYPRKCYYEPQCWTRAMREQDTSLGVEMGNTGLTLTSRVLHLYMGRSSINHK